MTILTENRGNWKRKKIWTFKYDKYTYANDSVKNKMLWKKCFNVIFLNVLFLCDRVFIIPYNNNLVSHSVLVYGTFSKLTGSVLADIHFCMLVFPDR